MKKLVSLLLMLVLFTSAFAANVTYNGDAKEFVFAPGSEYSPTDLFTNFKDVMPGDVITQKITLRHDSSADTVAKIYMRSRGAHPESGEFLSQLKLQVNVLGDGSTTSLFDNAANEAKPLEDWVLLGTLQPGAEVDLDVVLTVPVELDNMFSNLIGYLDWHFMVEEFPVEEDKDDPNIGKEDEPEIEPGDEPEIDKEDTPEIDQGDIPEIDKEDIPVEDEGDYPSKDAGGQYPSKDAGGQSPFTGDNAQLWLWVSVMVLAAVLLLILLFVKKKRDSEEGHE